MSNRVFNGRCQRHCLAFNGRCERQCLAINGRCERHYLAFNRRCQRHRSHSTQTGRRRAGSNDRVFSFGNNLRTDEIAASRTSTTSTTSTVSTATAIVDTIPGIATRTACNCAVNGIGIDAFTLYANVLPFFSNVASIVKPFCVWCESVLTREKMY